MASLSMNEVTTYRWSFEQDVLQYQAAGFQAMGVWRQKLSDYGEEKGMELLLETGLKVSNLLWAGGFTGSEGRSHRESVDDALEAIHLASGLNAPSLVLYSGSSARHTSKHARRLLTSAIHELLPLAKALDITLAIEPMHPSCAGDWTFITTLEQATELLDEIPDPHLKLALDTYHLGREPHLLERIDLMVDRIAIVHLGDCKTLPDCRRKIQEQNRCPLGEGKLPIRQIIVALSEAGYDGFYDVELFGEEIECLDYHELLDHSKRAFSEMLQGIPAS